MKRGGRDESQSWERGHSCPLRHFGVTGTKKRIELANVRVPGFNGIGPLSS